MIFFRVRNILKENLRCLTNREHNSQLPRDKKRRLVVSILHPEILGVRIYQRGLHNQSAK